MYRLLRNVHLVLGLLITPFLVLYAVSALQMGHPNLLKSEPNAREQTRTLVIDSPTDANAIYENLRTRHGVRGDLVESRVESSVEGATQHLRITRPGTEYNVTVRGTTVTLVERTGNALRMLNRLHHATGTTHSDRASNLWGIAVWAVSVGLLAVSLSGLWMWLTRKKERRIGLMFLATSVLYAAALLTWTRLG